jgi:antitoxin PrlF
MKALVTSKGQVTIPKPLRDQFGIEPGTELDFVATTDGIRVRKTPLKKGGFSALGCLRDDLAGRTVEEVLVELRGPVELPPKRSRN